MNMFIEEMDKERYEYENSPIGVTSNIYIYRNQKIRDCQGKYVIISFTTNSKRPVYFSDRKPTWSNGIWNAAVYDSIEEAGKFLNKLLFFSPKLCKVYLNYIEVIAEK